MQDPDFFQLPQEDQIAELVYFSTEILTEYPISVSSATCINFEYNATIKVVTTGGEVFALRININSQRNRENLEAEVGWVQFLYESRKISTAKPVATSDGRLHTSVFHERSQRTLYCVLYIWLDGSELEDKPPLHQIKALGAAMASMHALALDFQLPQGSNLPRLDDVMWFSEDFLLSNKSVLDSNTKALISSAHDMISAHIAKLYESQTPRIIHADLHGGNVLWLDSSLSILDFDDCGIGLPIQDLAVAIYYLDTPEQDAALLEGYSSVGPLPEYTEEDLDVLLLQRRLHLLNYLYETSNAEHRALIPEYLEESLSRILKFTERYSHNTHRD